MLFARFFVFQDRIDLLVQTKGKGYVHCPTVTAPMVFNLDPSIWSEPRKHPNAIACYVEIAGGKVIARFADGRGAFVSKNLISTITRPYAPAAMN